MSAFGREALAIFENGNRPGRPLTRAESQHLQEFSTGPKDHQWLSERIGHLGPNVPPLDVDGLFSGPGGPIATNGPGDMFVQSKGYKSMRDPGTRPQQWSTGPIEVGMQYEAPLRPAAIAAEEAIRAARAADVPPMTPQSPGSARFIGGSRSAWHSPLESANAVSYT